MDFKSKGIAWVGDIYQRFETMCHEVDSIVNQDPVKYVENQVHTVGKSMKKFCSEVVQVVDPVRSEAQKGNAAVGNYIKSVIGQGHKAFFDQTLNEPIDFYNVNNDQAGLDLVNQSTTPTSDESLNGKSSVSAPGSIDDVPTIENSDPSKEEDAIEEQLISSQASELVSPCEKELLNAALPNEYNENLLDSLDKFSPSTSVDGEEFQPPQKVGTVRHSPVNDSKDEVWSSTSLDGKKLHSPQKVGTVSYRSANDCDNQSDTSCAVASSEFIDTNNENACVFLGEVWPLTSIDRDELQSSQKVGMACFSSAIDRDTMSDTSCAVALSEFIDSNNKSAHVHLDEISPSTSVDEEELKSPQKLETVHYNHVNDSDTVSDGSSAVAPSELALSVASSCGSIFTEPRTLPENSFNNILTRVVPCVNPVDVGAHDSDSSNSPFPSASAPIVSSNKEVPETRLTYSNSVLSLESAGCSNDSSYIDADFEGSGMETIDLADKLKLEESCVMVDNSMLYEASCRIRKLRSFKDVLNSRKNLSKEYEQLAVWFGDLDIEFGQDTSPDQLPSSTTTCVDPDNRIDSEWELL